MRVAFITNRTTRHSLPVLRQLHELSSDELIHIYFYDTLGQGSSKLGKTISEFGWFGVLFKIWQLVASKLRLAIGRRFKFSGRWATSSYEYAVFSGIPYSIVANINAPEVRTAMEQQQLDLLIVAICKNILKKAVLQIPNYGAINIHPSLLPKYRGPTPIFWALYYNEPTIGVTFHRMTERIDEGAILGQYSLAVVNEWSEEKITRKAFELAAGKLAEVLERVADFDGANSSGVSVGEASYFTYPTPDERKKFRVNMRQRGRRQAPG
jgi:folate-dependent phosphoribosylglycinamide formyltransferase PurN